MTGTDDDTADYPPPASQGPVQGPPVQDARYVEGRHVSPPGAGGLPEPDHDLWKQLDQMRELFRVARSPWNDPVHVRLTPGVKELYHRIRRELRRELDNDELFDLFCEVQSYLLRRDL